MYAKAKRTFTTSSMPTQQSNWKHHNMEVSCAVWLVYHHSFLKFQNDSQVLLSEVLLKCIISGLWCLQCRCQVKQYHAVFAALNTSHCIVWLRELAVQGAETGLTAPVVFLVKTSVTFFTLADVVYSCSFLAVVSFSDLLLLQNTHMQPLN